MRHRLIARIREAGIGPDQVGSDLRCSPSCPKVVGARTHYGPRDVCSITREVASETAPCRPACALAMELLDQVEDALDKIAEVAQ